mmetsp:Transcript_58594/g.130976  ORF Transcript_58594/g.130976 Transcript_58594/m.130976 type:complete len:84 (-) Transcript_58594:254-505(-)
MMRKDNEPDECKSKALSAARRHTLATMLAGVANKGGGAEGDVSLSAATHLLATAQVCQRMQHGHRMEAMALTTASGFVKLGLN